MVRYNGVESKPVAHAKDGDCLVISSFHCCLHRLTDMATCVTDEPKTTFAALLFCKHEGIEAYAYGTMAHNNIVHV